MSDISLTDIIKRKTFKIDETFLWSILVLSVETIQNSKLLDELGLFLITPDNTNISSLGSIVFTTRNTYNKIYYPPECQNLYHDWTKGNHIKKTEILIYSLGTTLKCCIRYKYEEYPPISKDLWSIVNQMIDRSTDSRMTLSTLQSICNTMPKKYIQGQSVNAYLATSHQASTQMPKMMRSLSTSSIMVKNNIKKYERNQSHDVVISNEERKVSNTSDSSFPDNVSTQSTTTSDGNVNPNFIWSSKNGNLFQGRMNIYSKPNITAAMERVKAMRKLSKNTGPMKSPSGNWHINGFQSVDNLDAPNGLDSNYSTSSANISFTELANIERLDGSRRILGPEFIIRQSEIFNVISGLQRKNSLFSRHDSSRYLSYLVQVHLLNGVKLFVRNLNKQSILGQVINSIHASFPDLEFVNYGLCFSLDNEYFYLKEDVNIHKIGEYVIQKLNSMKLGSEIENKKVLHLYYRIKFYPTIETIYEMNSFNRKLLYLQLRHDLLLDNNPPISLKESHMFAGIAVQAEFGYNVDDLMENFDYLRIEYYYHYLFLSLIDTNNDDVGFLKIRQEDWSEEHWEKCEHIFIEKICQNKYYGMHWYRVNKNQHGIIGAIGKNTYLVIGRDLIQLLDSSRSQTEIQMHKHFSYKWRQIESISIKNKKLIIKPKMQLKVEGLNTSNAFVCYLDSKTKTEYIVKLCHEHHLQASQNDDQESGFVSTQNSVGSHRRLSIINYPSSLTKTSFSYDGSEDISSDEELSHNPRYFEESRNLSKQKHLYFGSLNNLSNQRVLSKSALHYQSCQDVNIEELFENQKGKPQPNINEYQNESNGLLQVDLVRDNIAGDSLGLGIIKINTQNCEGIFIKHIMKGSETDKCGKLLKGDEIISVNGHNVSHLTQKEVGDIIKSCGKVIKLIIKHHLRNYEEHEIKLVKKTSSFSQTETTSGDFNSSEEIINNLNGNKFKIMKNITLEDILNSDNVFQIFKQETFDKYFPFIKLTNDKDQSEINQKNLDELSKKEIKKIKASHLLRSIKENDLKPYGNEQFNLNKENVINVGNILIDTSKLMESKIISTNQNNQSFKILQLNNSWNSKIWEIISECKSKLLISFNCKTNNLFTTINQMCNTKNTNSNCQFSINVEETHSFSKSITFYRLSIITSNNKSRKNSEQRVFLVNFVNWMADIDNEVENKSIIEAINIVCGINENIKNSGPIILCGEHPKNEIGVFISLYSIILLEMHRKLPITLIIKYQTLIYEIHNQMSSQMNEMMLNEYQYRICISLVKPLISYMNTSDSQSDISDIN